MAISTNGTVIARLAGGLYNTVMSNATYLEVAAQDPSTLANTLYTRDFAKSTDLAVATTLVTNLGLSTVAGLDNWVAAQLTAAGSAKGAKIVSMLNDFAGMAADATYGAAATAFNTKVDAALAASQKTGSVESKFEAAGTVASTAATFTLTTGVDGLDKFTGGAGNDTFNSNVASLGALDSIDGGAGVNTLNITDSVSVGARNITATNIQVVNVSSSAGAVGNVASLATIPAKQNVTYDFTGKTLSNNVTVTVGGVVKAVTSATVASMAAAIEAVMDEAYATDTDTDGAGNGDTDTQTWATVSSDVITVAARTAGTALPVITFAKSTGATGTLQQPVTTTVQKNQGLADAVAAATFAVPTGATTASISAATQVFASSVTTADTTVTATAGTASLSGGKSQTVTAGDSVTATGSTGAVVVTVTAAPATELTAASSTTGWGGGAGVYVSGGSSVVITEAVGAASSGAISASNATPVQVGANPANASGTAGNNSSARKASTADGYPETIGNSSAAPKGDVSVATLSTYTNKDGYASVKYGTGDVNNCNCKRRNIPNHHRHQYNPVDGYIYIYCCSWHFQVDYS
jgi:hypothetical protein